MKRILTILSQKWPEYLMEILVITIGILGAFALNNWNESRKARDQEILILQNLRAELEGNFSQWDFIFERQKVRHAATQHLLSNDLHVLTTERLDLLMDSVLYNWTFNPSRGVYQSIINSGKLDLISNRELRTQIAGLGDKVDDYIEDEASAWSFSRTYLQPLSAKSYSLLLGTPRTSSEMKELKNQLLKTALSQEYRNNIKLMAAYLESVVLDEGPLLEQEFKWLIGLIDKELVKLEG